MAVRGGKRRRLHGHRPWRPALPLVRPDPESPAPSSSSSSEATKVEFKGRYGTRATLIWDTEAERFELTLPDGEQLWFNDFNHFSYDNQHRAVQEKLNGGARKFTFNYTTGSTDDSFNQWATKTIESRPDGSEHVVYTNRIGQPLIKELRSGDDRWIHFRRYDDNARRIEHALPSAVIDYSEDQADLIVSLKPDQGLIRLTEYYAETGNGGAAGYVQARKLKRGDNGVHVPLLDFEYLTHTASGRTVHPLAKRIEYRNDDGTGGIVTEFSYSFHQGTVQVLQRQTTLPIVPESQHGTGVADQRFERFDIWGRPTWTRDERGFITRQVFDPASGAMIQRIEDVDTTQAGGAPSGWNTLTGGGLHLVTDYLHDSIGRITRQLGPVHSAEIDGAAKDVRRAQWHVYLDGDHQQRLGQGYYDVGADAYFLINPVSITIGDASGMVHEEIEAVRDTAAGELTAADSFPQSSYSRWTTRQFADCCRLASERVYHTIPASGAGQPGTNYDETEFGYDSMNRRDRTVSPGGTIHEDEFDVRGLIVAHRVGTTASGGQDMTLLWQQQFDGGLDGGDGNLTRRTEHVDDTATRVTDYAYD